MPNMTKSGALLFAMTLSILGTAAAVETQDAPENPTPPMTFYKSLTDDRGTQPLPGALQASRVLGGIKKQPQPEIAAELPFILAALKNSEPDIRRLGALGFIAIASRPDGAVLLSSTIPALIAELQDPVPQVAALTMASIAWMHPAPPKTVIPPLIEFLSTEKAQSLAGKAVVGVLLNIDSNDQEITQAVIRYLDGTEGDLTVGALEAMAVQNVTDKALIAAVVKRTSPGFSEPVRFAAVHTIGTMGAAAVKQSPLKQIANDPAEDSEIRTAAQQVLAWNGGTS